jgi:ribosomal protein S8
MLTQNLKQNFYHLFGELKKANNKKSEMFFFKTTKNHDKILYILLKEGYILSYRKFQGFIAI